MSTFTKPYSANSLATAALLMNRSLDWGSTLHGHSFWSNVYAELLKLAKEAELNGRGTAKPCDFTVIPIGAFQSDVDMIPAALNMHTANSSAITNKKSTLVHILYGGQACCASKTVNPELLNPPVMWPQGAEWVYRKDHDKATCDACKLAVLKQIVDKTYDGVS